MNEEIKEMILNMFFDCERRDFNDGSLECIKTITEEFSYINDAPILKAYVVRKILDIEKPFFIIKYGNKFRDFPKYHSTVNKLFESREDAHNYVHGLKDENTDICNFLFEPYGVFEI